MFTITGLKSSRQLQQKWSYFMQYFICNNLMKTEACRTGCEDLILMTVICMICGQTNGFVSKYRNMYMYYLIICYD